MVLSISSGIMAGHYGDFEAIRIFAKVGFDAVDYYFEPCPTSKWGTKDQDSYIKELLDCAKDNNVYFNQAHAHHIFDWDEPDLIENKIIPTITNDIICASKLGAPHIIVHGLSHPAVNHSTEERMKVNIDYYNRIKPVAKEHGIKIALENLKKVCTTPDEYEYLMDALNDDVFTACVDVGHSFYVGQDAAEIIRRLGHNRVTALHVHDNHGTFDDHLIPGFGKMDFNHILSALADIKYSGDFNLELIDWGFGMFDEKHGFDSDFAFSGMRIAESVGRYLKNKLEKMIQ